MRPNDQIDAISGERMAQSERMGALATLPVFLRLSGKKAVVAGGHDAALWKAELLAAAGARVEVYATEFSPEFESLATSRPEGSVTLVRRAWAADDIQGAAVAVGAAATDEEAAAFSAAARAAGVPVNVIDRPEFCDFQFGAIVNRSPLIVGVSTDGAAPVFAQTIRSAIEALLPSGFTRWAETAKTWRRLGDRLGPNLAARRKFWERFADLAMSASERAPEDGDLERLLAADPASDGLPSVAVIAVSPAGADGLTLASVRALRTADHVFYVEGVPAAILDYSRREAHRTHVSLQASGGDALSFAQRIVAAATSGQRVVYLQPTGDGQVVSEALTSAGIRLVAF